MTATAINTVEVVGTAVFSERPAELARFYEQVLGVALEHRQHDDGREHWVTTLGAVHFEVKAVWKGDGTPTPDAVATGAGHSRIELSFRVADAGSTFRAALDAGATEHQPLTEYRWGVFGVVLDPDGNRVGIFAPPAGARDEEGDD